MQVEHVRHAGDPPDEAETAARLRREATAVHGWTNGPHDRYAEHEHAYRKVLYCVRGSIEFVLSDGRRIALAPGDRLVIPAHTRHSAVVGPEGCACVEGAS